MKFEPVTIDKIGKDLKHGETYTCIAHGGGEIRARFEYCATEYWWVREYSNALIGVRLFKRSTYTPPINRKTKPW